MGRLNRGPNGPFSGKAGSVIGSSWRGIFYIKGLQKKSNKPRSPKQIEQQERFTFAVRFLSPVKEMLKLSFGHINPRGATGYNMALSYMINNSIKGTYPNFEVDYPNVQLSRGKVKLPDHAAVTIDGMTLKVSWNTESDKSMAGMDDKIEALYYDPKSNNYRFPTQEAIRQDGSLEIELTERDKGRQYEFFLCARSRYGKWSNTLYLGTVNIDQ